MNIEELRQTDLIILEHVKGSNLYGTNIATSDIDIGGIFVVPNGDWLTLQHPPKEIGDKKGDEKYFELRRYFDLVCTANPTVLETLFIPKESINTIKPQAELLMKHGEMFLTKRCEHSYSGYAYAQIKKAKGKNKKVHSVEKYFHEDAIALLDELLYAEKISKEWIESRFNKALFLFIVKNKALPNPIENTNWKEMDKYLPQLKKLQSPRREDFCCFVERDFNLRNWNPWTLDSFYCDNMPFRPQKRKDLSHYDCSSVEHMPNLYRLYKNGKGLFRNGQLVYTSISKEREWRDFAGVMYLNEDEYSKQKREWLSFWEWMAKRNESRWQTDEGTAFDYDHKNMQHTIRLLMEAENIATLGKPVVRFDGDRLAYLREIRAGKYDYEYLLQWAEDKCLELKEIYKKSQLPYQVNMKKANELYMEIINF